ncbi:maleylacetate reductase [Mesorhizobium sp. BAC0120]|uniref:maleylacetate reductase n=1 Tax=Mesorhizobium sp. BAC0120 TaxID=3090670 RepID=UPI00298C82DC|nr:maleylacetate reductase [Mesorhizobium sp. BAC0120]MDW6025597.1 maleylacetate reductase [Mesorhizobium sp. BAC0120]
MMHSFIYTALPGRVVFGSGALKQLSEEIGRLGAKRALLLTTANRKANGEALLASLDGSAAALYSKATMHTPIDVTEDALAEVRRVEADCLVAFGGGSTIGLAKAIALRTGLPQIAIPTTYAGSEMTPILGETRDWRKTTQKSMKVLPEVVIYDVELTLTLPKRLSGTSGINAIAHSAEALYAEDANPVVSALAVESIAALGSALPRIAENLADRDARSDAQYGAFLAGACLGSVGMALHHKLCHTLGGLFDLPHADTHSVILPHTLAYNAPAVPKAIARIAGALGVADAPQGLFELSRKVGAPRALKEIGMPEEGIDQATDLALSNPYWNPRPLERQGIRNLIAGAWAGEEPFAVNEGDG